MDDHHTPIEDRLRSALTAGIAEVEAEAGPPVADPADLARRRVRHHRSQRAGRAAAVAAVVVAAAVGGWALGLDTGGDDGEQVTSRASTTSPAPELGADDRPLVTPVVPQRGVPATEAARTLASSPSGPGLWYSGAPLPTTRLFTRTLDDGTEIEVRGNRYDISMYYLPPFWDAPEWCFPSGDLSVRVPAEGGDEVPGVGYDAVVAGTMVTRTGVLGARGDTPRWATTAQVPAGTATVQVSFPGGGTDEAAPVEGLAVLSAPVADGVDVTSPRLYDGTYQPPAVTVVAVAEDGTELARYEDSWTGIGLEGLTVTPPYRDPACAVPTTLPPPGVEQPADPVAAEVAIRDVWDRSFGIPATATVEEQLAVIDDPRGVRPALEETKTNVSPEVLEGTTVPIDALVFAGPEVAFVHYAVTIEAGVYAERFGELRLVDGEWKVARQTACDLATAAAVTCSPLDQG